MHPKRVIRVAFRIRREARSTKRATIGFVGKKVNLPVLADDVIGSRGGAPAKKKPSIDAARTRLGGRVTSEDASANALPPGAIVTVAMPRDRSAAAVVLFNGANEVHVLLDAVRLRRLPPSDLTLHVGEIPEPLARLSAEARLFGLLSEGQSVRYASDGGELVDGKVVEKCRWGALVLRGDGAVVAVGFRKLWPAEATGTA